MVRFFTVLVILLIFSALVWSGYQGIQKFFSPTATVQINDVFFEVEIAKTAEQQEKGLMFRQMLTANSGMLFVFDESRKHEFWMKNTRLPLDIVWMTEDGIVVDKKTADPCPDSQKNCPIYISGKNAKYVLEVNAGAFPGSVGDRVEITILEEKSPKK